MENFLLLTTMEACIVVALIAVAGLFLYLLFNGIITKLAGKVKITKRPKKHKEAKDQDEKLKEAIKKEVAKSSEEKQAPVEKTPYDDILDKVHQNRQAYFETEEAKMTEGFIAEETNLDALVEENAELVGVPNKNDAFFDDFDFDSLFEDETPVMQMEQNLELENMRNAMRRKRMIRRKMSIGEEINNCSTRIKTLLVLDIFNKKLF